MSNWMDQGKRKIERQQREAERQRAEQERQAKAEQIRRDLENKQQLDFYKQKLTPFFAPLGAYKILSDVARELGLPDAKIEDGQISTLWSSEYTVELFASLAYSARTSEMQASPFKTTTREYKITKTWRIGVGNTNPIGELDSNPRIIAYFYEEIGHGVTRWSEEITVGTVKSVLPRLYASVYEAVRWMKSYKPW